MSLFRVIFNIKCIIYETFVKNEFKMLQLISMYIWEWVHNYFSEGFYYQYSFSTGTMVVIF